MEQSSLPPYGASMASITAVWVLAHQGGWDEILFVLGPLVIFAGLLVLARRRVDQLGDDEGADDAIVDEPTGTDPT